MSYWNKKHPAASAVRSIERKNPHYMTLVKEPQRDQLYSVIISDLQGIISPRTVQSRVYVLKEGDVQWGQKGTPYSMYANDTHYKNNIRNYPVYSCATPMDFYNQIEDQDKIAVNLLKKLLTDYPNAAFWHNGHQDPGCQFNGLHLHVIMDPGSKDINNQRTIKNLRTCLQQRGINFRAQKVKQTAPRILIGSNNLRMLTWLTETESQQMLFPQKDMQELLEDIPLEESEDKTSANFMEGLMSITQNSSMMSMMEDPLLNLNEHMGITYIDRLSEFKIPEEDRDKYLTVHETARIFNEWCLEQGISQSILLSEMYTILAKKNAKINTLLLHGESNAGKTYWSKALSPFPDITGQTIQSADFAWSRCVDKEIVMIPELSFTKPEKVEEAKKIFEGLPTSVNIKNKEERMMQRTPILLQCNTLPWARQFSQERNAFLNRSFYHIDLKQSGTLAEVTKEANPNFLGKIFKDLQEFDKNLPTWMHGKTDPIWDLLQDQAMKLNDKSLVNWVVGDNFTDFLKGNMTHTNWTQYHGILTDDFDRLNACRSFILDSLDPYDKDQSIWSHEYIGSLSAWLLAITNESACDYVWNLDNYEQPFIVDAKNREELHLQDVDNAIYESLRLSFVTVSLVYNRMQKWVDQPNVNTESNMIMMKDSTFVVKKCVGKIKEYIEFIIKSTENMKKDPEDGSVPRGFYPLVTSTPNKQHHVRIPDRKWPTLMKVQAAKDTIEGCMSYWIMNTGFYYRNDRGEYIFGPHYEDPVMAGRTDAEFDRIVNGTPDSSPENGVRRMYKSHMF